jgi:hypothetical protein
MRVVQAGNRTSFPLESFTCLGLGGDVLRQDFDGDRAIEARVSGPVHFAHATGTKRGDDFIRPKPSMRRERHDCSVQVYRFTGFVGKWDE